MKHCVFGAGAIGSHLAARLALVHGTAATSAGCSAGVGQMAAFGREVCEVGEVREVREVGEEGEVREVREVGVAGVAGEVGVATPTIDMLLALVRGLDRMRRAG
jgi:hypothetical protein